MSFNRKTLSETCWRIVGRHYEVQAIFKTDVAWNDDTTKAELESVYLHTDEQSQKNGITFDMLQALSGVFKTTNINLGHEQGWTGSDLTPADPCSFEIYIRDIGSIK